MEVLRLDGDWALLADFRDANQFGTIPVPQDELPVRLTSKRYYKLVICRAEGTSYEFLRLVGIRLVKRFW